MKMGSSAANSGRQGLLPEWADDGQRAWYALRNLRGSVISVATLIVRERSPKYLANVLGASRTVSQSECSLREWHATLRQEE